MRWAAAALALLSALPGRAEPRDDFDFALWLAAQQDPYRAIGALKRFAFDHPGTEDADRANLFAGLLYSEAKEPAASMFHFRLVADLGVPRLRSPARLLFVQELCLAGRGSPACLSELEATDDDGGTGVVELMRAVARIDARGPPDPALPSKVPPALQARALALLEAERERAGLSLKSPLAAGLLSAVVPGLGQVYDGRWLDGVLALLLTGGSTAGCVALATQERPSVGGSIALGALATVFWLGGISNAVSDAQRINEQRLRDFSGSLEQGHWPRVGLAISRDRVEVGVRFGVEPPVPLESLVRQAE